VDLVSSDEEDEVVEVGRYQPGLHQPVLGVGAVASHNAAPAAVAPPVAEVEPAPVAVQPPAAVVLPRLRLRRR